MNDEYDDIDGYEYEGEDEKTDEEIIAQAKKDMAAKKKLKPKVAVKPKVKPKKAPKPEPETEEDDDGWPEVDEEQEEVDDLVEIPQPPEELPEEEQVQEPIGDGGLFQQSYKLDKENFLTQDGTTIPVLEAVRDACNKVDILYRMKLAELQSKNKGQVL